MATLVMPQAVGVSTGSCSVNGILNARRCTPAAAAFSGCISSLPRLPVLGLRSRPLRQRGVVCALTEEKEKENEKKRALEKDDAESVTKKFGLEAGLWKIFTTKEDGEGEVKGKRTNQAKVLLARYGGAYLATSISLSLVSFALCYFLVQSGVDVPALLEKIGIHASGTGEKVGTFALAYAAHKAASPIRFPPTVALTPIVAGWFGKKPVDEKTESK